MSGTGLTVAEHEEGNANVDSEDLLARKSSSSSDGDGQKEEESTLLDGYMQKMGEKGLLKGWKTRFFILRRGETSISYFRSRDDLSGPPIGQIDLQVVTDVRPCENNLGQKKEKGYCFEVVTPPRTYILQVPSEKTMKNWMEGIRKYMSMIHDGGASATLAKELVPDSLAELGALLDAKGQSPSYGQLFVNVKEATGLELNKDKGHLGVYCMLALEKQVIKTRTLTDFSDVCWEEGFFFDVTQLDQVIMHRNTNLIISVWATDISHFGGENLGQLTIPIKQLFHGKPIDQKCKLSRSSRSTSNRPLRASLHLKLHFTTIHHKVGLSDFNLLKVVGKGNFGKVMQVRKNDTGRIYAMKVLRKETVLAADAVQHTLSETSVLRRINHPFIVNLKYAFQTKDKLYMILDYLSGGELFYHLSNVDRFSEDRARFYAAEIVSALGYLHSINVVYRDLKPENLLLDISGHVCLTDFGLVKDGLRFGEVTHTFCGSPEYLAPEILRGKGYGREVDWWALGTFLYEMLEGLPPYYDEDIQEMNRKILHAPLEFEQGRFTPEAKSILRGLLQRDPKLRLGSGPRDAQELKEHPFFKGINWEKLEAREIEPTFKPHLQSAEDVRYFDPEFTTQTPKDSFVEGPLLAESKQRLFDGFSFVSTSAFEQLIDQRRKVKARTHSPA